MESAIQLLSISTQAKRFGPPHDKAFRPKYNRGFTLVELMTVVALVGILGAIAIPQYQNFVKKSRRVEAVINLEAIHAAQFAFYGANDEFCPPVGASYTIQPRPDYVWAPAIDVLKNLGLEAQEFTKMGWEYGDFFSDTDFVSPMASWNYRILMRYNQDDDGFYDVFLIHYMNDSFPGAASGRPVILEDDIYNLQFMPYVFKRI